MDGGDEPFAPVRISISDPGFRIRFITRSTDGRDGYVSSDGAGQLSTKLDTRASADNFLAKTSIFVSYARKDADQVDRIAEALSSRDITILRDTTDILPTEQWRSRLVGMIGEANAVVCFLSPSFADSEVCAWELQTAAGLSKKLVPIQIADLDASALPEAITSLNWLRLRNSDEFASGVARILEALHLDVGWIREHTRLGQSAAHWDAQSRSPALLLRGKALDAAETWIAGRPAQAPAPTPLHQRFITESRKAASRRSRILSLAASAVAVSTSVLAVLAYLSDREARSNLRVAEARRLSVQAVQALEEGYPQRAALLARQAILTTDATGERVIEASIAARQVLNGVSGEVIATTPDAPTAFAADRAGLIALGTTRLKAGSESANDLESHIEVLTQDGTGSARVICRVRLDNGTEPVLTLAFSGKGLVAASRSHLHLIEVGDRSCRSQYEQALGDGERRLGDRVLAIDETSAAVAVSGFWPSEVALVDATGAQPAQTLGPFRARVTSAVFVEGRELLLVGTELPEADDAAPGAGTLSYAEHAGGQWRMHDVLTVERARDLKIGGVSAVTGGAGAGHWLAIAGHSSGLVTVTEVGSALQQSQSSRSEPLIGEASSVAIHSAAEPKARKVVAVAWHEATSTIVSGHEDGSLGVWRLDLPARTLRLVHSLALSQRAVSTIVLEPGGTKLVAASDPGLPVGATAHACDLHPVEPPVCRTLVGHEKPVIGAAITRDGKYAVTAALLDPTVRKWVLTGKDVTLDRTPAAVSTNAAIGLDASGKHLIIPLSTGETGRVVALDTQPGEAALSAPGWPTEGAGVGPLAFSDNGRWILAQRKTDVEQAGAQSRFELVDVLAGKPTWRLVWETVPDTAVIAENGTSIASFHNAETLLSVFQNGAEAPWRHVLGVEFVDKIVFSPDGAKLVAGTDRGDLWLMRFAKGLPPDTVMRLAEQMGDVRSVAISPDSRWLAAAGFESKLWLWDLDCAGGCAAAEHAVGRQVRKLLFSPSGKHLAAATVAGEIALWQVDRRGIGAAPLLLRGHDGDVKDIAFSRDGRLLVSASFSYMSTDNSIRLWSLDGPDPNLAVEEIARGADWFQQVLFDREDSSILARDDTGRVSIWPISPRELADRALSFAGRDFTPDERRRFFRTDGGVVIER